MKKKEFSYKLEVPIIYQCQTGEKEAKQLLFKAPRNKHKDKLCELRKELISAMGKYSEQSVSKDAVSDVKKEVKTEDGLSKEFILFFMYGPYLDIKKYREIFWDMVTDGLCFIENDVPLTKSLVADLDADDEDEIIGEYTANFITPRWLKQQMSK
jgi:hypothetical protein